MDWQTASVCLQELKCVSKTKLRLLFDKLDKEVVLKTLRECSVYEDGQLKAARELSKLFVDSHELRMSLARNECYITLESGVSQVDMTLSDDLIVLLSNAVNVLLEKRCFFLLHALSKVRRSVWMECVRLGCTDFLLYLYVKGDSDLVSQLTSFGCRVGMTGDAMRVLILNKKWSTASQMLLKMGKLSEHVDRIVSYRSDKSLGTLLHDIACYNEKEALDLARECIALGVSLSCKNVNGETASMMAERVGNENMLELFSK
jgi:hypothetical protein|tara:strand:- start:991 stop:1770 length:780 start_codon:yes stop_codon:yes gene_type:complete